MRRSPYVDDLGERLRRRELARAGRHRAGSRRAARRDRRAVPPACATRRRRSPRPRACSSTGGIRKPFLVDLGRVRRHRTGRHAAEVGVVRAVRGPADERAVVGERGRDERDVVEVRAARERVVDDDLVAGPRAATPHASIAARTAAGIDPRCTGMCSACTSSVPSAVNSAAEQSARSLMFGLYAARRSTAPISSATPVRREISTWSAARDPTFIASSSGAGEHPRAERARLRDPALGDPHRAVGLGDDRRTGARARARRRAGRRPAAAQRRSRGPAPRRPRPARPGRA